MDIEKIFLTMMRNLRGQINAEEIKELPITFATIGGQNKNKLQEMAASNDSITNQILAEVQKLPISVASKELLSDRLESIFEKLSLPTIVDIILNIAKLLEIYQPIEIVDASITKLSNFKASPFLPLSNELIQIIKEYFKMQKGATIHSGITGHAFEITKLLENNDDIKFYGQDSIQEQLMLAEIRLMLSGIDYEIGEGDVLKNPLFIEGNQLKQFDYVYNTPRFGMRLDEETMNEIKEDPYNRFTYFGIPSRANGDLGYIISSLQVLNSTGKGAFILPASALTRSGADSKIRERFIQADIVDVIVELPEGIFAPVTSVSTVLMLFNKNKAPEAKGNIQLINALKFGEKVDKVNTTISKEGLSQILDLINSRGELSGVSKVLSNQEVEDTQLIPSKYVFDTEIELEEYGNVEIDLKAFDQVETIPLSEIAEIYRGYNALPKDISENGNYAIIKISDVEDGEINYTTLTKYQLGGRTKIDNYQLKKGDLILPVRGHSLKGAVYESDREDVLLSQNFVGIRLSNQYDPYFIKLFIESPIMQFILQSKLSGTTVMNLPIKEVESLPIPKISLEKQQQIVSTYLERTADLKEKINQLQKELDSVKLNSFEAMGIAKTFSLK